MKILLPFQQFNGYDFYSKKIFGGIERFCKHVYDCYDVEVLQYPSIDIWKQDKTIKKSVQQQIKIKAKEIDADIILCNWGDSLQIGAGMVDSEIPIMHICHGMNPMQSSIITFKRLKTHNHSVFMVSEYQNNFYIGMDNRLNIGHKIDGIVEPTYLCGDKPKIIKNPEFDCITIGRCDKDKNPFLTKILLHDTNLKSLIMTNKIESGIYNNRKYYDKHKNWDDVLWDLEHDDVLKNLSKGRSYFMTWPDECFPITGLEALSRGLFLILNSRMTEDRAPVKRQNYGYPLHGGEGWPIKKSHYVNIMKGSKEELTNAINSSRNIDRQEIQDMTWDKYTEKRWKSILNSAIDKTIENFKSNRGVFLYD